MTTVAPDAGVVTPSTPDSSAKKSCSAVPVGSRSFSICNSIASASSRAVASARGLERLRIASPAELSDAELRQHVLQRLVNVDAEAGPGGQGDVTVRIHLQRLTVDDIVEELDGVVGLERHQMLVKGQLVYAGVLAVYVGVLAAMIWRSPALRAGPATAPAAAHLGQQAFEARHIAT